MNGANRISSPDPLKRAVLPEVAEDVEAERGGDEGHRREGRELNERCGRDQAASATF